MTVASSYDQAVAHYRAGRLDLCFQAAVEGIRTPSPQAPAELALLCLAEAGQFAVVDQILALARDRGLQPILLCRQTCANLLRSRKRAALQAFATGMPAGHPLRILAVYHAACVRLVEGDTEGALGAFSGFRRQVKDYLTLVPFIPDDGFNVAFRQGTLVLPADEVERRLAADADHPPASLDFRIERTADATGRALYAVSADGRYIERFARNFALALDRPGRALHIHVVNGTEAADRILHDLPAALTHLSLGVSRSADRHYATSTAFACTRFFVLPDLLRAYGRPIIALDIDIVPREPLVRLEAALDAPEFDFACYVTGRDEPASVYQASIMAWVPTAQTFGFLAALGRFCLPKLAMPARFNWMLDQAALISVMNWQAQRGMPFRYRPLGELLGCRFDDAVAGVASDEEKGGIKAMNAQIEQRLADADGFVHYDWSPE